MAIRVLTIDLNGSQCVMVGQCFNLRLWSLDSYSLAFIFFFFVCSSAFSCAVNLIFCFVVVFFFWYFGFLFRMRASLTMIKSCIGEDSAVESDATISLFTVNGGEGVAAAAAVLLLLLTTVAAATAVGVEAALLALALTLASDA